MKSEKNRKYIISYVILVISIIILGILNLTWGSVDISINDIISVLTRNNDNETAAAIIMEIRFPRLLGAAILGGALSVSGFLLQTFFNNPIAGPFVLGISSGAKLVVAITMITFLNAGYILSSWDMIFAALVGSMICMMFILFVSRYTHRMGVLIICGVMIGYFCSAITDFAVTFADDSNIVNLHNWSMGSFSGISWSNIQVMAIVVAVTTVLTFLLSKPLGAFLLGESYAQHMGVNVGKLKLQIIVLSGILSACVTAFAGPISFVGIAVPQIVKRMFKSTKPIVVIPACFLGGSAFCLFADLIARILFAPTELSISTVTSFLGAPIVIWIMLKRQNSKEV